MNHHASFFASTTCHWITPQDSRYPAMLALREEVLRKPLGQSMAPEDYQNDGEHHLLIAVQQSPDGEQVIGCLVLEPLDDKTLQMRQVAVSSQRQGQGIGRLLVEASETFLLQRCPQRSIVLNARSTVVGFYQGLGYQSIGSPFELIGISHQKMGKTFS